MEQSVDIICHCLVLISHLKTFYEVLQNIFAFISFVLVGGVTSPNNKLINILFYKYICDFFHCVMLKQLILIHVKSTDSLF